MFAPPANIAGRRVHPLSFYHIVGNCTTTFHDIHRKPRGYVLDLRSVPYSMTSDEVSVSSSETSGWGADATVDVSVLRICHESPNLFAFDVCYEDDRCRCILDATRRPHLCGGSDVKLRLKLDSIDRIVRLQDYLLSTNELSLGTLNVTEILRHLSRQ